MRDYSLSIPFLCCVINLTGFTCVKKIQRCVAPALNVVQLFRRQAVHTFSVTYFTHIKTVKFRSVNVCEITRQWESTFREYHFREYHSFLPGSEKFHVIRMVSALLYVKPPNKVFVLYFIKIKSFHVILKIFNLIF